MFCTPRSGAPSRAMTQRSSKTSGRRVCVWALVHSVLRTRSPLESCTFGASDRHSALKTS